MNTYSPLPPIKMTIYDVLLSAFYHILVFMIIIGIEYLFNKSNKK